MSPADDRGAVMVFVAVALPVIVLFASFVVDIGNWFEHRRHLQMQADAAVLAAAGEFPAANFAGTCSNTGIEDMARTYGGLKPPAGDTYNQQVGGTAVEDVLYEINSAIWPDQPEDVDPTAPAGTPCETGVIDLKLAERGLPWFFRAAQVAFINAHARVQLQGAERAKGVLPVGVPDINPTSMTAFFVDEAKAPGTAGYVLATSPLCRNGTAGDQPLWGNGGTPCTNPDRPTPVPVPVGITVRDIGVRLALSGKELPGCDPSALDACYTTICDDASPLTACYDAESANGLVHIRGWSDEPASSTSPRARDVRLGPGSCPDGYFAHPTDIPGGATSCAVDVSATVDFDDAATLEERAATVQRLGASVTANGRALTYDPATGLWASDSSSRVPVLPGAGPVDVGLGWEITTRADGTACTGSGCSGTFPNVQRAFAAHPDGSGPVRGVSAAVHLPGNPVPEKADSFRRCADTTCVHDLSVTVRLEPSLRDLANGPNDTPVKLRLVGSGSLNQALDCDDDPAEADDHPDANDQLLRSEMAFGCSPEYRINRDEPCPGTRAELWASPQAWPCVATEQGQRTQEIVRGMNRRINGSYTATTCENPDLWEEHWADGELEQDELADDPRLVQAFLTPFGAFDASGESVFPVTQFAAFYVRNYTGEGGDTNPCPSDAPADEGGALVGHFVKYLDRTNEGEGSGEACSFDSLEICVPVLTR